MFESNPENVRFCGVKPPLVIDEPNKVVWLGFAAGAGEKKFMVYVSLV